MFCGNNPVNFRDPSGLCEDGGSGDSWSDIALQGYFDYGRGFIDAAISQFESVRSMNPAPDWTTSWQTSLLEAGRDWVYGSATDLGAPSPNTSGASYWSGQVTLYVEATLLAMSQSGSASNKANIQKAKHLLKTGGRTQLTRVYEKTGPIVVKETKGWLLKGWDKAKWAVAKMFEAM